MKLARLQGFLRGMLAGALTALALGAAALYALSMMGVILVSVPSAPDVQAAAGWIYTNLRMSLIPFALTFVLYVYSLARLRRRLAEHAPPERIAQLEHLVDVWVSLFFGIGVIWTAIGIRSALMSALGDLDSAAAAQLGAFNMLQRLVEGGIILALSTTIFGGVGGYLMRVGKALAVGSRLQAYYGRLAQSQTESIGRTLENIEGYLASMSAGPSTQTDEAAR